MARWQVSPCAWCTVHGEGVAVVQAAQPDLHERVEDVPQRGRQRPYRRCVQSAHPPGQVADLYGAGCVPGSLVVEPRLQDDKVGVVDQVHEAMFLTDAA